MHTCLLDISGLLSGYGLCLSCIMLTPAFEIKQNDKFLIIEIKANFAKVADTEIFIEDKDFKFYAKPYYLRLSLPGAIVEDGRESAKFDADTGLFIVTVPKLTPGQHFEGLDMLTQLLAPSGASSAVAPLIEVLHDSSPSGESSCKEPKSSQIDENEPLDENEEAFDWQIEQEPYEEPPSADLSLNVSEYGFANQRSGVFKRLQTELHEVIDLPCADSTPASHRRQMREEEENIKFDEDYYLSDLYENDVIGELLRYTPPWDEEYRKFKQGLNDDIVSFTDGEKAKLIKLPRKEYLLDKETTRAVFLGLVDLVFAYAYNHRSTEGENTVESAWTICKLSPTLSWLQSHNNLHEVIVSCYRRSLCFPLYRHWKLTKTVFRDVRKIFHLGKRRLVKALLEIHTLLCENDPRYILNDLYVTDYCVWIQGASKKQISWMATCLSKIKIQKSDVALELEVLEDAANLAIEEEQETSDHLSTDIAGLDLCGQSVPDGDDVTEQVARLNLDPCKLQTVDQDDDKNDSTQNENFDTIWNISERKDITKPLIEELTGEETIPPVERS